MPRSGIRAGRVGFGFGCDRARLRPGRGAVPPGRCDHIQQGRRGERDSVPRRRRLRDGRELLRQPYQYSGDGGRRDRWCVGAAPKLMLPPNAASSPRAPPFSAWRVPRLEIARRSAGTGPRAAASRPWWQVRPPGSGDRQAKFAPRERRSREPPPRGPRLGELSGGRGLRGGRRLCGHTDAQQPGSDGCHRDEWRLVAGRRAGPSGQCQLDPGRSGERAVFCDVHRTGGV
jgi:hypothetical protein